jgi:hypothetical protein
MIEAISKVLETNNNYLNEIILAVKSEDIDNTELILRLSILHSSLLTLEAMTAPFSAPEVVMKASAPIPPMKFLDDVADDNPEQEDIEAKKLREENRNFYG